MADDPPSTPLTGKNWAGHPKVLTTGSLLEKATRKPDNQAEEEPDAKVLSNLKKLAMQQEEQYFQELYELAKDEHKLKMHMLQKTMQQERQPALEPGRKVADSQRSRSGRLDLKEGHRDMFDPRKDPTMHHHLARGRWENTGAKNEAEPHINMYPTAKDLPLEESQDAWIQWVNAAFPNLHGTQFWLPVCAKDFASLYCSEEQSTLDTSHQHAPWYNLVKNDSALQRVLLCLKERSEAKDEVMFVLSQLYFGQNSGEPCYSAAADYLPPPHSVPPAPPRNWEEGDFDLLIIHRTYGLVVCEVKAFGDNSSKSGMSQQDVDSKIRSKLIEAILQVDRAKAVLSHLVSDIVPGLRITKTIAFPNLTGRQVQQALAEDPILIEDLGNTRGCHTGYLNTCRMLVY